MLLDLKVLVKWNKNRLPGKIEEDLLLDGIRTRAQKAAHFVKRELEMRETKITTQGQIHARHDWWFEVYGHGHGKPSRKFVVSTSIVKRSTRINRTMETYKLEISPYCVRRIMWCKPWICS
jgi:hypothetical protein